MNEIFVALISLTGTIVLALIGYYGAKKYNIGPNQDKLVSTLNSVVSAQELRIAQLEKESSDYKNQFIQVSQEVKELRTLTIEQALTISRLETELGTRKGVRNVRKSRVYSSSGDTGSTEQ